jgi:hypothetical protein
MTLNYNGSHPLKTGATFAFCGGSLCALFSTLFGRCFGLAWLSSVSTTLEQEHPLYKVAEKIKKTWTNPSKYIKRHF